MPAKVLLTEFLKHFLRQPIIVDMQSVVLSSHLNGRLCQSLGLERQMSLLSQYYTDAMCRSETVSNCLSSQ